MSTHNIGFYEDLTKISLNYHQISSFLFFLFLLLYIGNILLLQTVYGGDRDINLLVKHVVNNQILAAEYTKSEGQVEIDAPYHGTMCNGTGITLTSFLIIIMARCYTNIS